MANEVVDTTQRPEKYISYSLYTDMASRIKASLALGRKEDPEIRIDMPFDKVSFDGVLKLKGKKVKLCRGVMHYGISASEELDEFFGKNWHVRGLKEAGDFNYVIVNTVRFWLYQRRPLVEYVPGPSGCMNYHLDRWWYLLSFVGVVSVQKQGITFIRSDIVL